MRSGLAVPARLLVYAIGRYPRLLEEGLRTRLKLVNWILELTVHQIYGEKGGMDDDLPIAAVAVGVSWSGIGLTFRVEASSLDKFDGGRGWHAP